MFRKQCINETEEFDFLKDIVANVDDLAVVSTSAVDSAAELKCDPIADDNETISEPKPILEDSTVNPCSISTILNEDSSTCANILPNIESNEDESICINGTEDLHD